MIEDQGPKVDLSTGSQSSLGNKTNKTSENSLPKPKPLHIGKPAWLKTPIPSGQTFREIKKNLREKKLFTVCEEAKCPNIGECWNTGTATFMILGDTCTRACRFCNVKTGNPQGWLDPKEAEHVAASAEIMKLRYAVITMVDRDDLEDGGSAHVAEVVRYVKSRSPQLKIELLAGDFHEREASLINIVQCATAPEVFAHNLETVERLSPRVRDARASYRKSLRVLKLVKELRANWLEENGFTDSIPMLTKSALMLGLGEEDNDIDQALKDLREHDVDIITLGQYMRPTTRHLSIKRFVHPQEFEAWKERALELGFKGVFSGPLVRSSYKADVLYDSIIANPLVLT